ncbi:MAG: hypothetical protein JWN95_206 [Frankiales bacterium]|nr:hypothetical protein [Frankiales bacterium]
MGDMTRPLTSSERQRLRSPANLWRALIVLLIVVGAAVVLVWPRGSTNDGINVIDVTAPIESARQQAGFPVVAPVGLPSGWRPTSTDFTPAGPSSPASFRIGYVSPRNQYAEFLESNDAADAVSAQYGPLSVDGNVSVDGSSWSGFRTDSGRQLIRHQVGTVTVIVTGSADTAELVQLAGSLR